MWSNKSLKALAFFDTTLSEFKTKNIEEYPQKLINLELSNMAGEDQIKDLNNIAKNLSDKFELDGRYLIRNSGTEPLLRVLIEAKDDNSVNEFSDELMNKIKNYLFTWLIYL